MNRNDKNLVQQKKTYKEEEEEEEETSVHKRFLRCRSNPKEFCLLARARCL
jgi:hypothetical protein